MIEGLVSKEAAGRWRTRSLMVAVATRAPHVTAAGGDEEYTAAQRLCQERSECQQPKAASARRSADEAAVQRGDLAEGTNSQARGRPSASQMVLLEVIGHGGRVRPQLMEGEAIERVCRLDGRR